MNDEFQLSSESIEALQAQNELQQRASAAQDAAIQASETPELPQEEASTQAPTEANNDVTNPKEKGNPLQEEVLKQASNMMPMAGVNKMKDAAINAAQHFGVLPTEGVQGEIVDAMKGDPLADPAMGLLDFGVNAYNFLMPGTV